MSKIQISDIQKVVKNQLIYPTDLISTRVDAARILQLSISEFDKLRRAGLFSEYEVKGVKFFENQQLFNWAHQNRPQSINFRLQFEESELKA